jgi:hypothetical protein
VVYKHKGNFGINNLKRLFRRVKNIPGMARRKKSGKTCTYHPKKGWRCKSVKKKASAGKKVVYTGRGEGVFNPW